MTLCYTMLYFVTLCGTMCDAILQNVTKGNAMWHYLTLWNAMLQNVTLCYAMWHFVRLWNAVLQNVTLCNAIWHYVMPCFKMWQKVTHVMPRGTDWCWVIKLKFVWAFIERKKKDKEKGSHPKAIILIWRANSAWRWQEIIFLFPHYLYDETPK